MNQHPFKSFITHKTPTFNTLVFHLVSNAQQVKLLPYQQLRNTAHTASTPLVKKAQPKA